MCASGPLSCDRTECQKARFANILLFLMKNFKRQLHKIKEFHHAMVSSLVNILYVKKINI